MPKGANQKFKLYRLAQIMCEKTDETHYLTMPEIQKEFSLYEFIIIRFAAKKHPRSFYIPHITLFRIISFHIFFPFRQTDL